MGRAEIPHRPLDPSGNLHFGVEIRGVFFENVPGAAAFCIIFAIQTVEIHAFSSSPTWNLTAKSINLRFRKGFPDMGSCLV